MRHELIQKIIINAYLKRVKDQIPGLTRQQVYEAIVEEAYEQAQKDFRVGAFRSKRDYNKS